MYHNTNYQIRNYQYILITKLVLPILLLFSCAYKTQIPIWLTEQPSSPDFWYGIATVNINESNYREQARVKASQEIASQIQIHIQSSFEVKREEINLNYSEQSKSIIKARADIVLPEVEIVETFTSDNKYHIYTRLNKEVYFKKIEIKKDKAIKIATDFIASAEKNFSIESFHYLIKALKEITPFLDYSLMTEYPIDSGKQINLNSAIYIIANKLKNQIRLQSDKEEIDAVLGKNQNYSLTLKCINNKTNNALENIPLKASMGINDISNDMVTDSNGEAKFHLFKISDRDPIQYVQIGINFPEFLETFQLNNIDDLTIKVNVNPASIYLEFDENNLSKPVQNPFLVPEFKTFLLQTYGAKFTNIKLDSDLYIMANINTTAKMESQNEYGLYQVYADCTISFYDTKTDSEIYQTNLNNVMGADFNSLEGAGRNALKKMVDKIKTKVFQEIVAELDGYLTQNK